MIRIILLTTFLLSFGNQTNRNKEYHKEYDSTGKVRSKGWLKNGSKIGYWRFYHSNGKLAEKGHYSKNKRSAYWYVYSKMGKIQEEGHYENGERTDWWLFYDNLGNVNHKCQLSQGIKNGYCLMYENNDIVKAEMYRGGKKIKTWSSFSSFRRDNKLSDLR